MPFASNVWSGPNYISSILALACDFKAGVTSDILWIFTLCL